MRLNLICLLLILASSPSFAHNVLGGVYAIGTDIEGEIGFSNGDMAAGKTVVVSDPAGKEIVRVATDDKGFFVFTAVQRVDHHFFADLGSGHVFETVLKAEELPDTLGDIVKLETNTSPLSSPTDGKLVGSELQALIEKSVAKQVKPLRQELNAYKEKASFQDVLGGIGYIFGLCGIGIWLNQRKQQSSQAA